MEKILAKNPTAYHNYTIENTIEAGIVLTGTEIKSIRNGKVNIKDTYVNIKDGEVFHQIYRGEKSKEEMYQMISDTLTILMTGGEYHA